MKTYYYEEYIQASPEAIHHTMLDHATYKIWTKPFSPTSDVRGDWSVGSKVYFISTDENGNEMGMIGTIDANTNGEIVIIRHIGLYGKGKELYEGPEVDAWKNALEVYRFRKTDKGTHVICSVELDNDEYLDMFATTWPQALKDLKRICEA